MVAWGIIEGAGLFGGVVALITGITWALAAPIVAFVAPRGDAAHRARTPFARRVGVNGTRGSAPWIRGAAA